MMIAAVKPSLVVAPSNPNVGAPPAICTKPLAILNR